MSVPPWNQLCRWDPFVTKNRLTPPTTTLHEGLQKVVWDVQDFLRQYHIVMLAQILSRLKVAFVAKNALGIVET